MILYFSLVFPNKDPDKSNQKSFHAIPSSIVLHSLAIVPNKP